MEVKGLFIGARVVRGVDWHWGDQDGNYVVLTTDLANGQCVTVWTLYYLFFAVLLKQ